MSPPIKWAWIILLIILFMGEWVIGVFIFYAVVYILIVLFKPKWLKYL